VLMRSQDTKARCVLCLCLCLILCLCVCESLSLCVCVSVNLCDRFVCVCVYFFSSLLLRKLKKKE
jgi:hypothetical protein